MDFKKFNFKSLVLAGIAGAMLIFAVIIKLAQGSTPIQSAPAAVSGPMPIATFVPNQVPPLKYISDRPAEEAVEEDVQSMKDMKEQMDNDRIQQKKIKMLKLQLEQTNLQLDQEKALSQINQLKKENTGVVDDSMDEGLGKYPEVKVIYIGGTEEKRQAILSINGINYAVNEKNRPVKNVEIISISNSSVVVHFDAPQELSTTFDYKPE